MVTHDSKIHGMPNTITANSNLVVKYRIERGKAMGNCGSLLLSSDAQAAALQVQVFMVGVHTALKITIVDKKKTEVNCEALNHQFG